MTCRSQRYGLEERDNDGLAAEGETRFFRGGLHRPKSGRGIEKVEGGGRRVGKGDEHQVVWAGGVKGVKSC